MSVLIRNKYQSFEIGKFFALKRLCGSGIIYSEVLNMLIRDIIRRMLEMSPIAWQYFIHSLKLCCAALFAAFILLAEAQSGHGGSYELYMSAGALEESVRAALLVTVLFSVCIEDVQR